MENFQIIISLMFAATLLVGISQKIHVPYPIALTLGGIIIGFYPSEKSINFDPNLVLMIVLPPILHYAAFGISFREFKHNFREILSLALGLVFATTLVIGILFKWLFPELPWSLAFTFGAIISPPDAVAATTILKRFSISTRLLSILEGESLINDASALVLYKLTVTALLSGVFSFYDASISFFTSVSGGVIVGFILGFIMQRFSRYYLEPIVAVIFSFTIPYIIFFIATALGVSGVLAVVTSGLVGSQFLIRHYSSLRRILGYATWDIFIILLNCFVFILIGLQLRNFTRTMTFEQMYLYTGYAFLITIAMIIVRMLWVYSKDALDYYKALRSPKANILCPEILREAAISSWSGMRGIVSLTAALALPFTMPDGTPLPGRYEVIYLTFVVIMLSLLIPGFTLEKLIRWLNIRTLSPHHKEYRVKKRLAKVAEETIERLLTSKVINEDEFDFLQMQLNLQHKILKATAQKKIESLEAARHEVIQAKRKELLEIWKRLEIDDLLLSHLEHELDLEETHFTRAELK